MLPKSGKRDFTSPRSTRPISLLRTISKVFEVVLLRRLLFIAHRDNWLPENLYGFGKGRSCEQLLASLISKIYTARSKKQHVLLVLLDFQGAFDRASHSIILEELRVLHYPPTSGSLPGISVTESGLSNMQANTLPFVLNKESPKEHVWPRGSEPHCSALRSSSPTALSLESYLELC